MRIALLLAALAALAPSTAHALCSTASCTNTMTDCTTTIRMCECTGTQTQPLTLTKTSSATPNLLPGTCYCTIEEVDYQPAGTACTADSDPCTTDACDGNGTCAHTSNGGQTCNGACIGAGTCCTSTDCAGLNTSTQTGVCPSAGATCVAQCNAGYKSCNGACIANTACCVDGDCGGNGHTCSGGACVCPGGYDCQGTCIPNMTCCTSPSTCQAGVGNGSSVCPSNGSQCVVQCNPGYKACGGSCIGNAACCTDGDCTSLTNSAQHDHGVCSSPGGSCVASCDPGYKACNGACIANSACCSAADCTSPMNGCYRSQGSCAAGACTYPFNDGASCNADGNACTPNDTCMSGSCVADTTHRVTCVQHDCHTTPSCNPSSGNCVDGPLPDGTGCGGNGCSDTPGMCAGGACSSTPKDCSAASSACQVGACNASGPVGAPCLVENVTNGTPCAIDDKCVLDPSCSGGTCTGDQKVCTPSGPCRTAACDPASGDCGETIAAPGTACAMPGACIQHASCDDSGNCTGDPVPDGTPCEKSDCMIAAVCGAGACQCSNGTDLGTGGPQSTSPDGGTTPVKSGKGCSTTPGSPASPVALVLMFCALYLSARRARR